MDGWMDGWTDGRMDGWLDGWVEILCPSHTSFVHVPGRCADDNQNRCAMKTPSTFEKISASSGARTRDCYIRWPALPRLLTDFRLDDDRQWAHPSNKFSLCFFKLQSGRNMQKYSDHEYNYIFSFASFDCR